MGCFYSIYQLLVLASFRAADFSGIAQVLFRCSRIITLQNPVGIFIFSRMARLSDADINACKAQNAEQRNGKR